MIAWMWRRAVTVVAAGLSAAAVLLVWAVTSAMERRTRERFAQVSGPPVGDELGEAADRGSGDARTAADEQRRKAA